MKKKLISILAVVAMIVFIFINIGKDTELEYNENKTDGFFIWMDAYVALPIKSEFTIALTYYYFRGKEDYIHKDDIASIAFEGISNVKIKDFSTHDLQCANENYNGYSINITVEALELGTNKVESINVRTIDGNEYKCSLGEWYFDVDIEDSGYVDAYSSAFVTAIPTKFHYNYIIESDGKISELQYWYDKSISENILNKDVLFIESEAPFNYIKSKGTVEIDNKEYKFYGLGSYCGILNVDEQDIKLSNEHNKMQ